MKNIKFKTLATIALIVAALILYTSAANFAQGDIGVGIFMVLVLSLFSGWSVSKLNEIKS